MAARRICGDLEPDPVSLAPRTRKAPHTVSARTYENITFSDPNPVKRWIHRSRLTRAIALVESFPEPRSIMDFGAGNGELCKRLASRYPHAKTICYEPIPAQLVEARQNLANVRGVSFLSDMDGVEAGSLDLIFCLEVFEHLPPAEMQGAFSDLKRVLAKDGHLVVGVPVEIGVPALYKGVFRMMRRYGEFDATARNVAACVIGRPPDRPVHKFDDRHGFYYHHTGFDHRRFLSSLRAVFDVCSMSASPFPRLGVLNPELYAVAKRKKIG